MGHDTDFRKAMSEEEARKMVHDIIEMAKRTRTKKVATNPTNQGPKITGTKDLGSE